MSEGLRLLLHVSAMLTCLYNNCNNYCTCFPFFITIYLLLYLLCVCVCVYVFYWWSSKVIFIRRHPHLKSLSSTVPNHSLTGLCPPRMSRPKGRWVNPTRILTTHARHPLPPPPCQRARVELHRQFAGRPPPSPPPPRAAASLRDTHGHHTHLCSVD